MYHKSADSWYIGTRKRGFEPKNEGDVPRKHEILVHHFLLSGKQSKTLPENREKSSVLSIRNIFRGGNMIFSDYYNAKNPSKWGNYSNF